MRTNTYLANRYFDMLRPLDDDTKLQIVTLLVNSLSTNKDAERQPQAKSLFDLYGVWANDPDGEMIEKAILERQSIFPDLTA